MTLPHHRERAIFAVISLSDALAEIATYVNEGPKFDQWAFGEADVVMPLSEALIRVIAIEIEGFETANGEFADEISDLRQLSSALHKFVSDWSGQ